MPDGGVSEFIVAEAIEDIYAFATAVAAYSTYVEVALVVAAAYQSYESGVRARNAYNASLRDRYVMQRTSTGQRSLVLGRARTSGPIAFMHSYGTNQSTLAIVVVLAAHECDAIEKIYFNDQAVVLDSVGNVTGILNTEHFSVNNSSTLNVFLAVQAQASTVTATAQYADAVVTLGTSLNSDGLHLALSGARATGVADVTVTYQPTNCQYTPNQLTDQSHSLTAAGATGSYTFPATTATYVTAVSRGVTFGSASIGGNVNATSIVVVHTLGNVQTALPFTATTDSTGYASSVSWSGATAGAHVQITYQAAVNFSRARIRQYRGAPGQTADSIMVGNLPGMWTTNHVGNGICYLVCEFDFDQSSFSAGLPNVSAVLRGAKVYDPRTGGTNWSENPAILTRGYWTHALGAAQPLANVDDNAIIAAANVCDAITAYIIGPVEQPQPRPAPLYTAGYVATRDQKPQDVLTDLCMAMGGRWVISANLLRVKAGSYTAPVAAIDGSWLTSESSITVQPLPTRQTLFNTTQGSFCDERNDYRAVPYTKVLAAALVTSDGRELDLDLTYMAVTKSAQAQYLSACAIRYNRAGMTIRLACNLKAFPLEVFDVVTVTLPRFGFVAQTFEVTDTSFTPEGLIVLTLKFISAAIWALDPSYSETAYAPKTLFPEPWNVQVPILGTPQTGSAQLLQQADGTIVSRIYVPIGMSDVSVVTGGFIDVAYIDGADTTGNWSNITIGGDQQGVYISPVKDGHVYLIKARARNTLYASAYCPAINCVVQGQLAPPANVSGMTYLQGSGRVHLTWTACPDIDYKQTEVRVGTSWAAGTLIGVASGTSLDWTGPAVGSYELWFAHQNRSLVYSATPEPLGVTVDASINVGVTALAFLYQRATSAPALPTGAITYTFTTGGMTGITSGWSTTPPAGTNPLYVTVASAIGPGATASIAAASWSTPVVMAQNGINSATVTLYQRTSTSTPPTLPDATVTYTFLTGVATGQDNGWTQSLPTTGGSFRWMTLATAAASGSTDTIAASEWAAASLIAQDGVDGAGAFTLGGDTTMAIVGGTATKTGGVDGAFDAQAYSVQGYSGGAVMSFTPLAAGKSSFCGLNSDPLTDSGFPSVDYAIYLQNDGSVFAFQSGAPSAALTTWTVGDVFSVAYDNASVRFLKNGAVLETISAAAGQKLFLDSSFAQIGASVSFTFAPAGAAGATGPSGLNTATVYAYQRASSAPAVPSADVTFTFATAFESGMSGGWSPSVPTGTLPLWVTTAAAVGTGTSVVIHTAGWATPVIFNQNGADGLNAATVFLYQRTGSTTPPALPDATVTYTFGTGIATGQDNGWVQSLPTTGGAYRWITTAAALSAGTTDTIAASEWAAASLLAQDGATGATGAGAISATLSSDTYTLPADSGGHVTSYTGATTTITVLNGGVDDTSNWTISKADGTGVTSTLSGASVTDTALADADDTGYIDITATRTGYASITKRFSLTKAKSAIRTTGVNGQMGDVSGGSVETPHTVAAYGGIRFATDGRIWKKSGGVSAAWTATSQVWWIGAPTSVPPTSGYVLSVNLISAQQIGGSTYVSDGIGGGTLGAANLDTFAHVTNGIWNLTYGYSISDSSGNSLEAGNLYLSLESSD